MRLRTRCFGQRCPIAVGIDLTGQAFDRLVAPDVEGIRIIADKLFDRGAERRFEYQQAFDR